MKTKIGELLTFIVLGCIALVAISFAFPIVKGMIDGIIYGVTSQGSVVVRKTNNGSVGTTNRLDPPTLNDVLPPAGETIRLETRHTTKNTTSGQDVSLIPEPIYNGAPLYTNDCVTFDGNSTGVDGPHRVLKNHPVSDTWVVMTGNGTYRGAYVATVYRGRGTC